MVMVDKRISTSLRKGCNVRTVSLLKGNDPLRPLFPEKFVAERMSNENFIKNYFNL